MHTYVMLILITWCLLNDVFSMTKALNCQNSPKQNSIVEDLFLKRTFHGRWGNKLLRKNLWGFVLHRGLMIRSFQGRGSLANPFSSNLNTVNLKTFPDHDGIYT